MQFAQTDALRLSPLLFWHKTEEVDIFSCAKITRLNGFAGWFGWGRAPKPSPRTNFRKVLLSLLLVLACTVRAETITGRVVGVADGDTMTVLDANKVQHKIRLSGIDAPEKSRPSATAPKNHCLNLLSTRL